MYRTIFLKDKIIVSVLIVKIACTWRLFFTFFFKKGNFW